MNFLVVLLFIQNIIVNGEEHVAPPGTVPIGENRFIDKNLIKYIDYYEFINWKLVNKAFSKEYLPKDTTITYQGEQLWHNRKYDQYPIVGLERDQVIAYCKWRSEVVNYMKANWKDSQCNAEYWIKHEKADPHNDWSIQYDIPSQQDLDIYKEKQEKYWLNEYTKDGLYERKKKHQDRFSNKSVKVFRCIAYYVKRESSK